MTQNDVKTLAMKVIQAREDYNHNIISPEDYDDIYEKSRKQIKTKKQLDLFNRILKSL